MRIALVNPKYEQSSGASLAPFTIPPLSLMKCGWILKEQGHEVEVRDFQVEKGSMYRWAEKAEFDTIIVSTAQILNWQCPQSDISNVIQLLKILKERKATVKIIGPHSLLIDSLHEYGEVLLGEPEGYMFDLKTQKDWDISSTGKLRLNSPEDYFFPVLGNKVMTFEAIRGCSVGCDFCFQGMYRSRKQSLESLTEEIRNDVKLGYTRFFNVDLNFTIDPKYVEKFSEMIVDLNIEWAAHATLSSLKNLNIGKLARSGCQVLMVGIENRHQRGLPNKNINEEFVKNTIRSVRRDGVKVGGYFILGSPDETEEDVLDSMEYAKELHLNYASFQLFHPIKGTSAHEELGDKVALNSQGFSEFYHGGLDMKWLEKMQKKAFRSFYFRPQYVWQNMELLLEPRMVFNGMAAILSSKRRI